jgi:ABC-type Fe3+-hydroxamate transport system substrate-binding protein
VPPRRVVSLCPSITETLVAIGGLKRLAAATRYCVRPKGLLWGLPRIGGTKDPDVARIRDLKPDLVFANQEENRIEDVRALEEAGIEVDVTFSKTVAHVPAAVRRWGNRLGEGSEDEAEALARRIEEAHAALLREGSPVSFRYAYWIWKDPWMTINDDTYIADLLGLAGGVNVFGRETERYPTATPSEAGARSVRVHFLPSEPYPFRRRRHEALAKEVFGGESLRLFVEGDDYCWHGVRTLDGLRAMRELKEKLNSPVTHGDSTSRGIPPAPAG